MHWCTCKSASCMANLIMKPDQTLIQLRIPAINHVQVIGYT